MFPFYRLQVKLILPYVVLTLLVAATGTYVITRLVTSSVRERFVNQLFEASRVAADGVVRQERAHLESLRPMIFTEGVAPAFLSGDGASLQSLLFPLALNADLDLVAALDVSGGTLFALEKDSQGGYSTGQIDALAGQPFVQLALQGQADALGDKYAGLAQTAAGPLLVTAAPVRLEDGRQVGVVLIGTRVRRLLADLKIQALADLFLLFPDRSLLDTTLAGDAADFEPLLAAAGQVSETGEAVPQDVRLYNRDFQVIFSPLLVRTQPAAWMGVVLPSEYVAAAEATSRNSFVLIFALGTLGVILIGYLLARHISHPILQLRSLSMAVASGDLDQQSGFRRSDEIGDLAQSFDQMTLSLRERTAEAQHLYEETVQRNAELAEINARLQQTQLQLVQSEKLASIGQLIAGIVHDVKNPLATIKGLAEVLQMEEGQTPSEELELIRESAEKANRIVSDLLKFARQTPAASQPRDLRETVEAALRLSAYMLRKGQVEVQLDLPDEPQMAVYDAQQIEQVLINLIANAIQAMPGGGQLFVSLAPVEAELVLSVRDTGGGIAPEHLGRIFDPFFTTKPEGQGTGLGLSVSYGIIANHGGRITADSQRGSGATFTIFLPLLALETILEKDDSWNQPRSW